MTFTIENVIDSVAGVLRARYPDYPVYGSPNQQGTKFPCFFIFLMPSTIEDQVGGRFFRDLALDIVFVQQRKIANGNAEIREVQEYLDEALETFPYYDGSGGVVPLHTFERRASTEDEELHYQLHIRQRVSLPRSVNLMLEMEETDVSIIEK